LAQFRYEGTDADGGAVSGTIEALNRSHAMVLLRETDLRVRALLDGREHQQSRQAIADWGQGFLYPLWPVSPRSVGVFFDQLGRLLDAGVTAHEAFTDLVDRVGGRLRRVVREGIAPIADGTTISRHLAGYPRFFPAYVIAMLRAGEISGALRDACSEIVHQCKVDQRVRDRWLITKLYFGFLIMGAILVAPFPRILITRAAMEGGTLKLGLGDYADHVFHYIAPWLLGLWLLSKLAVVIINLPAMVGVRDWLALCVPLIGTLTKRAAVARFTRAFELLQRAAVPLGDALRQAAQATGSVLVARRIAAPVAQLERGGRLTDALRAIGIFSSSQISVMQTAEDTGTLDGALTRLATQARESRDGLLRGVAYGSWAAGVAIAGACVLMGLVVGYTGLYETIFALFETEAWQP
jgi:type IV pilus assembly protein PilC